MLRRILTVLSTLVIAAGILGTSLLRASAVDYSFSGAVDDVNGTDTNDAALAIDYDLPYPGEILPDNPFWIAVAARDRARIFLSSGVEDRVNANQILADRRLAASKILFEKGNAEDGFSTLTKAEKYLYESLRLIKKAEKEGLDVSKMLETHAKASLKHREEIDEIKEIAPEDAKPEITKVQDYSINSYKDTRDALNERGLPVPENPFESD